MAIIADGGTKKLKGFTVKTTKGVANNAGTNRPQTANSAYSANAEFSGGSEPNVGAANNEAQKNYTPGPWESGKQGKWQQGATGKWEQGAVGQWKAGGTTATRKSGGDAFDQRVRPNYRERDFTNDGLPGPSVRSSRSNDTSMEYFDFPESGPAGGAGFTGAGAGTGTAAAAFTSSKSKALASDETKSTRRIGLKKTEGPRARTY